METHPLHQLIQKETCDVLLGNFSQVFSNAPQICLVDVEGNIVGQYPIEAQEIHKEQLLSAIDMVRRLKQLAVVPIGVAAPVLEKDGQLAGAIIIVTPHALTPIEISALQLFVNFLNTLVESSQIQKALFHETLDRYRDLDLLYKAGENIASSLDLATVNRLLLDESMRITQADEGAVMLWDQAEQQLTVWASRGLDAVKDIGAGIPPGYEVAKDVMRSGQTKIVKRPELGRRERPLTTLLCIPLRTKDEMQGIISLAYTNDEHRFSHNDVNLLNALAGQASVAIDNAQMFSDLIKLHTELESANRRLLELDQLKSSFLGVITHELRSPFANIDFSMQLIERYGTSTWSPDQREQWQQLTRLTNEAQVMIDHLVSFAGLLIKRGDLYWTGVDFCSLVQQVVNTLMPTALSRQVNMHIEPAEAMPPIVGDKMRLAEATHHLIHNAIKFNHVGGTVKVRYWQKDSKLTFQVTDSGIGIPAAKLELLWNSFSQVADPLKRGVEGLGLGLAMVKYVVNAHGGEVSVVSQEGGGSTFSFWLPANRP